MLNAFYAQSAVGASWTPISTLQQYNLLRLACTVLGMRNRYVAEFLDEDDQRLSYYRAGDAFDTIGEAEALLSHLVTRDWRAE